MAATGKKSKKQKWVKASITDVFAEPTTIPTVNSWAESVEDEPESYGGYQTRPRAPVVLPSASRAARGGMAVDDESIPRRPPYIAYISNLPYDVDESAITELFAGLKITNLRLPREGDRLKGFGYVDFEDRESLVSAMNIPDLTISGRRIRIDVSTHDNDRRMGRSGRNDRERDYDPERTMGDWRSGPRAVPEAPSRPRPERDSGRDRDRDRERDPESTVDMKPGAWREAAAERPAEPARAPYGGRDSFGRDRYGDDRGGRDRERGFGGRDGERSGYGGRDGFRTAERDGYGGRDGERRGFGSRGFGDRDRDRDPPPREDAKPRERPKLNLLPRTVPRDPEPAPPAENPAEKPKPVPAEKVFGAAKPVDTAAKEREIEERLRKQEEEARRAVDEKDRWGRRNDHSGDRRGTGGARRDDRGRDSRSYNKDKRDYSKEDNKDRREYSRDDRDKRDYSRDNRDRRDYSRDDSDRRDYSREDKRENSGDRRESRDGERRDSRERDHSRDRRDYDARAKSPEGNREANSNGRPSRSRDRHGDGDDKEEKPLPQLKQQEKPNFVASNKFSFLESADDSEGGSE